MGAIKIKSEDMEKSLNLLKENEVEVIAHRDSVTALYMMEQVEDAISFRPYEGLSAEDEEFLKKEMEERFVDDNSIVDIDAQDGIYQQVMKENGWSDKFTGAIESEEE